MKKGSHVQPRARWLVLVLVVIVALIVAIWPRSTSAETSFAEPGVTRDAVSGSAAVAPEGTRAGAALLTRCPAPAVSQPADVNRHG